MELTSRNYVLLDDGSNDLAYKEPKPSFGSPANAVQESRVRLLGKIVLGGVVLAIGAYCAYPYLPIIAKSLASSSRLSEIASLGAKTFNSVGVQAHSFRILSTAYYANFTTLFHATLAQLSSHGSSLIAATSLSTVSLLAFVAAFKNRLNKQKETKLQKKKLELRFKTKICACLTSFEHAGLKIEKLPLGSHLKDHINCLLKACDQGVAIPNQEHNLPLTAALKSALELLEDPQLTAGAKLGWPGKLSDIEKLKGQIKLKNKLAKLDILYASREFPTGTFTLEEDVTVHLKFREGIATLCSKIHENLKKTKITHYLGTNVTTNVNLLLKKCEEGLDELFKNSERLQKNQKIELVILLEEASTLLNDVIIKKSSKEAKLNIRSLKEAVRQARRL